MSSDKLLYIQPSKNAGKSEKHMVVDRLTLRSNISDNSQSNIPVDWPYVDNITEERFGTGLVLPCIWEIKYQNYCLSWSYDKQGDIDVRLYQVDLCLDRAMPAALRVSNMGSLDIGMQMACKCDK